MNINPNVQQVQQPGQLASNNQPTVDNNAFNSFQSDDFAFDLDPNTGELVGRFVPQGQQPTDRAGETLHNTPANLQPNSAPNGNNQVTDPRLENLENAVTKLAMFVEGLARGNQGQQQQQPTQLAQDLKLDVQSDDFATNLVTMLNQMMDKRFASFEEKLNPINQNLNQVNDRIQLTDLAMKYGQDFIQKLPTLLEYKKGDPNANVEKLYLILKGTSTPAKQDGTIQTNNGGQHTQPQSVDQALQQRANQLATERNSITNSVNNGNKATRMTFEQAINAAIAESYKQ